VLEVCNGIAFFTSFWRWMRKPRVLLVFHVHQEHYVTELGLRGRVAAFLLEQVPLQIFYPGVPVITISQSSREDLVALGVERERIHVVYCGLDSGLLAPGRKAAEPTLIYLGRLKQYKRIELLLDVVDAIPATPDGTPSPIEATTKQALAAVVRQFYRDHPEALASQASGAVIPPTVSNHR